MALFTEGSTRGYSSAYRDRLDGRDTNTPKTANSQNPTATAPGAPAQTIPTTAPSTGGSEITSSMDTIKAYRSTAWQYITPTATQTVAANTAATQATPAANSGESYGYNQLQLKGFTPSDTGEKS